MIKVGQGSKSHDFVGDLDMSFLTSSSVNGWKKMKWRWGVVQLDIVIRNLTILTILKNLDIFS